LCSSPEIEVYRGYGCDKFMIELVLWFWAEWVVDNIKMREPTLEILRHFEGEKDKMFANCTPGKEGKLVSSIKKGIKFNGTNNSGFDKDCETMLVETKVSENGMEYEERLLPYVPSRFRFSVYCKEFFDNRNLDKLGLPVGFRGLIKNHKLWLPIARKLKASDGTSTGKNGASTSETTEGDDDPDDPDYVPTSSATKNKNKNVLDTPEAISAKNAMDLAKAVSKEISSALAMKEDSNNDSYDNENVILPTIAKLKELLGESHVTCTIDKPGKERLISLLADNLNTENPGMKLKALSKIGEKEEWMKPFYKTVYDRIKEAERLAKENEEAARQKELNTCKSAFDISHLPQSKPNTRNSFDRCFFTSEPHARGQNRCPSPTKTTAPNHAGVPD